MSKKYLEITAKPANGIRRAGYRFGSTAQKIPLEDLSDEQIAMIKGDANLVVHESSDGEVPVPSTADADALQAAKIELKKTQNQLEDVSQERDAYEASLVTAEQQLKDSQENLKSSQDEILELKTTLGRTAASLKAAKIDLAEATDKEVKTDTKVKAKTSVKK